MSPEDALEFAVGFQAELSDGWGFLAVQGDDGIPSLIVSEAVPPFPAGWVIWLAKPISGGRILKGGVYFTDDDGPERVERRAWMVLELLRHAEVGERALWN